MKKQDIDEPDYTSLTPEEYEIYDWLQNITFQKTLLGGVDESDVWKKIQELNQLYEKALLVEKERYDTLYQAYLEMLDWGGGLDDEVET